MKGSEIFDLFIEQRIGNIKENINFQVVYRLCFISTHQKFHMPDVSTENNPLV